MATFLKSFFAPKWQHSDSNVRLNALDQLNDQQVLQQLATQDPSQDVRLKAISLIQDNLALTGLFADKSAEIKQAAIAQYLTLTLNSEDPIQQRNALESISTPQVLMTIATYSSDQELAQNAINKLNDESSLLEYILSSVSAKSRLLAAEKIETPENLKVIEKHYLNKDKNLVRYVKNKLTEKTKELEKKQTIELEIQNILDNAEQLAKQVFSPTYAGQVALLKQSITQHTITTEQQQRFDTAINQCESILAEHKQQQAKINQKKEDSEIAVSLQLAAINILKDQIIENKSSVKSSDDISAALFSAQEKWKKALDLSPKVDQQIKKEFETALKPLVNLQHSLAFIEKTEVNFKSVKSALENPTNSELKVHKKAISDQIKSVNWPNDFPENKLFNSLITLQNELESAISSLNSNEKQVLNELDLALMDFENAIKDGHIKHAKQTQNVIRKKLDFVDNHKAKSIHAKFQQLNQTLNELKDWQGFATLPKFEALCQEMENLIDSELSAKQQAKAIHDLQDQWKALGSLPNQKQQQALWQQFKQASDKAYEPCQTYFKDLARVRSYNLEQRTIICEELEHYFESNDWTQANWKSAQQILDKAHVEFKKFSPVDHTVKKAIMQRFHDATHNIHNKLVGHFKENAAEKQALINNVKALHDSEDLQDAIEQCKAIQNQWKESGNAGRAERQLWTEFRANCDSLFEKRNEASQARKQHLNSNIEQANELVSNAKALLKTADTNTQANLKEIREQIHALDLPVKVQQGIAKTLDNLQSDLNAVLKQARRKAQHALWLNAQNVAKDLGQAEQTGADTGTLEQDIDSAEIPNQVKAIFQTRLNKPDNQVSDTLYKLCLELEIILEVESPQADQTDRMALQVERLQKNMGQQLPSLEAQLEALQCRWFAIKADDQDYDTLHHRFFSTLNAQFEIQI